MAWDFTHDCLIWNSAWFVFNIFKEAYQYRIFVQTLRWSILLVNISSCIWYEQVDCTSISCLFHYNDVIMSTMASQITNLMIVYTTVYSGTDQRKHQSFTSLAFVREIHLWPVNSPHKCPVTQKMFPFDDVIMFIDGLLDHLAPALTESPYTALTADKLPAFRPVQRVC